jgi:hypothetical protein
MGALLPAGFFGVYLAILFNELSGSHCKHTKLSLINQAHLAAQVGNAMRKQDDGKALGRVGLVWA